MAPMSDATPRLLDRVRRRAPDVLAAAMGTVGAAHFVLTDTMVPTIPDVLPAPRTLVLVSGVVEVGCAVALWRRWRHAGVAASAVLLAVWPANIQMALDAGTGTNAGVADDPLVMWARVPLQIPMIWAALQADRR